MTETFRARLRKGEPLLGTFLRTPSSIAAEVMARSGLDVICVDAEHAPFGRIETDACVATLRAHHMPSLVRVIAGTPEHILAALDSGATGVLVPHVTSAAQAREIAKAAHFGPGGRGYAGSSRAAGFTTKPMGQHLSDSARDTTVITQIEDLEAVDAVEEIAKVDGIDALFIGRMDLTVALGAPSPGDAKVLEAVRRICRAGKAAARAVGMFVADVSEVPMWLTEGAGFFLMSSDHGLMLAGAKSLAATFADARAKAGV